MFRILGSIDALNKKRGSGLTLHDVNWVYSLHNLKGLGYYLKSRHPEVRLIQCLPESNKGLKNDFLIVLGEWHDGLPCPTRERQLVGALGLGRLFQLTRFLSFIPFLILTTLCFFDDFADRHVAVPKIISSNFSLPTHTWWGYFLSTFQQGGRRGRRKVEEGGRHLRFGRPLWIFWSTLVTWDVNWWPQPVFTAST